MRRSDLPFGSEFSPSQIDLAEVLELAAEHGGDWRSFEAAVWARYFSAHNTSEYNQRKLANNTKLGMQAYGLIDDDAQLTSVGQQLHSLRTHPAKLYAEFGRHILLHLPGMTLVQCVLDMQAAGEEVTLISLRHWLEERGIHFPRGGKHPSMMRLWLEKAGVFVTQWRVDEGRLAELIGTTVEEFEALATLSAEQKAYLKTLANMGDPGPLASNDIEKLATATYGVRFNEKALAKQVLYPLRDRGFITLTAGTKEPGRGAKPSLVVPTGKLQKEIVGPLLAQLDAQVVSDLRPLLRKPLAQILEEVQASDKHVRGLALEALAFKLMRLLDLSYVATRLRGSVTGGAEVDLIFQASRLVFSRWQVQCKNTARVTLDDVAKEVGLTHFLKSNVIIMVTTGTVGPEARRYANRIMADSNLCVVMVDGPDLAKIEANPTTIVDVFDREARHAMKLKALDLGEEQSE